MAPRSLVIARQVRHRILTIRERRVMLDTDLAALYEVDVKVLNQAVKRNLARFPPDFMFQLSPDEAVILRSQIVTLDNRRGAHRKYQPYAFTEQGIAMLSGVLRSSRAVLVNIEIMRVFVHLRELLQSNADLARRVAEIERKSNRRFRVVFEAIRGLMALPKQPSRRIGF